MSAPTLAADALATSCELDALVVRGAATAPVLRRVAEERAIAIEINGLAHAVMLATPADLDDFALGFLLSEGLVDARHELLDVEVDVADAAVATGGSREELEPADEDGALILRLTVTQRCLQRVKARRRSLAGRTGCGLCGVESIAEALRPVRRGVVPVVVAASALARGMAALAAAQHLQPATGATHAAAWLGLAGNLVLLREDVGRHNALDKLLGALARAGVDAAGGFVAVTSRASYEMVHKAASARIGLLAAISAPTALAVRCAKSAGMTLAGFARGGEATLYARPSGVRADGEVAA